MFNINWNNRSLPERVNYYKKSGKVAFIYPEANLQVENINDSEYMN